MERFRCTNPECHQPVLFEGEFVGIIQKICPKCKKMITFERPERQKVNKFCNNLKNK